ncbi:MAG: cupin domain-containing protein, partial [Thermoanaerobaculia bacterium]
LRQRYPDTPIGYSTHEDPGNVVAVQLAIAKGAVVFEKHVGLRTPEFGLNDYSALPEQVTRWLESARAAFLMCGVLEDRRATSATEAATLRSLRRGVFARRAIAAGESLDASNTFLAIPTQPGQLTANELSKYTRYFTQSEVGEGQPLQCSSLRSVDTRDDVHRIEKQVKQILRKSKVVVPGRLELEISHHYGLDRFGEYGAAMVTLVNREYCKKLIVQLPGQTHPEQYHKEKEETFHVLWGDLTVILDGVEREIRQGDIVLVERGVRHAFRSASGVVIEELSSTHRGSDSFTRTSASTRTRTGKRSSPTGLTEGSAASAPVPLKTIVWDVDDVLNDLTRAWFETAWRPSHSRVPELRFEDLVENPPHRILGVDQSEYLDSLDFFRASEQARGLSPRGDVLRWFEEHGAAFRHVALSAVPASAASASAAWVVRNFGRWIRVVGFVPSSRPGDGLPRYDETKKGFLEWWG